MTATDINNYNLLCDSLSALLGAGTCQPLSSKQVPYSKTFSISPNPAPSSFSIRIPTHGNFELDIFDMQGRLIKSHNVNDHSIIDITNLFNAIYILHIEGFEPIALDKN